MSTNPTREMQQETRHDSPQYREALEKEHPRPCGKNLKSMKRHKRNPNGWRDTPVKDGMTCWIKVSFVSQTKKYNAFPIKTAAGLMLVFCLVLRSILTLNLWGRVSYPYCMDKETEAQRHSELAQGHRAMKSIFFPKRRSEEEIILSKREPHGNT